MIAKAVKLRNILEVQNGFAFKTEFFHATDGVPLIRIRDLDGDTTDTHYTGEFRDEFIVSAGDYLIGMDGNFHCRRWTGTKALLNQRVCRLRNFSPDVLPEYVFFGIQPILKAIEASTSFATVKHISARQILDIALPLPPVSEQRRIVDILSRAEGIVRLRREAEKKAAELIPALFLDMFGDPATNPKGWPVRSLGELCDRITDGTHQPPKFQDSGIPFIFISNIVRGALKLDTTKYISDDTYVELTRRCPIEVGDVLYSTVGSYGVPVKVDTEERFSFQRHIAHIKPKQDKLDSDFLVGMLYTPAMKAQADSAARGIAQKTINLGEIRKYQIIAPPLNEQQRFASRVVAARSIQSQQSAATDLAQATFDALLSKVFANT